MHLPNRDFTVLIDLAENIINRFFACIPRATPSTQDFKSTRIIAHRGAHHNTQGFKENTPAAFKKAAELGCWGIEFDLHQTADKVLVVNHDPDLQRLWGHKESIANLSFAQLRNLEPNIPSLDEVVKEFGRHLHLFIEIKSPFIDARLLFESLKDLRPEKDYHILSLKADYFSSITQFPKACLLLVPLHNNVKAFCNLSLKEQYGGVLGSYVLLTASMIKVLQADKQKIGVGFVDSKNGLYREINRGIRWIFTNNAEEVVRYMG